MKAGVSTACMYPLETEDALRNLCDAGVKNMEIFINTGSELKPDYIKSLGAMLNNAGARVTSLHPYTSGFETMFFFTEYERRFLDGIEFYKNYFNAAATLGGKILVLHGMTKYKDMPIEEYAERFERLAQAGREQGITLCHENVERTISRDPSFFAELKKCLPNAKFVLDIKQSIRAGYTPYDFIEAMGSSLHHIHISDNMPGKDCLPIGKGNFDFDEFFRKIKETGYDRAVILELYSQNHNGMKDLSESYNLLEKLI